MSKKKNFPILSTARSVQPLTCVFVDATHDNSAVAKERIEENTKRAVTKESPEENTNLEVTRHHKRKIQISKSQRQN